MYSSSLSYLKKCFGLDFNQKVGGNGGEGSESKEDQIGPIMKILGDYRCDIRDAAKKKVSVLVC